MQNSLKIWISHIQNIRLNYLDFQKINYSRMNINNFKRCAVNTDLYFKFLISFTVTYELSNKGSKLSKGRE